MRGNKTNQSALFSYIFPWMGQRRDPLSRFLVAVSVAALPSVAVSLAILDAQSVPWDLGRISAYLLLAMPTIGVVVGVVVRLLSLQRQIKCHSVASMEP